MLVAFADDTQEARTRLGRVGLGGWVGAAAASTEAELTQLNRRLGAAETAFDDAGHAVGRYAGVHAEARARAAEALRLYQSAAPTSAAAHGALLTVAPTIPVEDPDGTLARAGAMLQQARQHLDSAARALAKTLEEAQKSAPSEPGFLAGLKRAIKSLAEGAFEASPNSARPPWGWSNWARDSTRPAPSTTRTATSRLRIRSSTASPTPSSTPASSPPPSPTGTPCAPTRPGGSGNYFPT
ncbi:MAG TPA: hypothetical protein VHV82_11530 [Sporichthyaceae bacterium]|nr:hypothetical protein [Sporichthyaceae bacterium]